MEGKNLRGMAKAEAGDNKELTEDPQEDTRSRGRAMKELEAPHSGNSVSASTE